MARTRTWSTTIPVDHTAIKLSPTKVRDLRVDIEERVDGILAGFVNTGTTNGLLLARLLTVGTANALTPGTGTAGAYDVYALTTGSTIELFGKDNAGNVTQFTKAGKIKTESLGGVYPVATVSEMATLLSYIYPVGSIYINASVSTSPADLFGFGTWAQFGTGCVMVGLSAGDADFDTLEERGGAKTHTLLTTEMPAHTHTTTLALTSNGAGTADKLQQGYSATTQTYVPESSSTGGGGAHTNVQPYIVVYMWKRSA